jgi:thymidylate synthase
MIVVNDNVSIIRTWFKKLRQHGEYVTDKTGCRMLEVVGATFLADEESIFGTVNRTYVDREIEWYRSMSCNVNDIPGGPPKEWLRCADSRGFINSNYGYLVWSHENGFVDVHNALCTSTSGASSQYEAVVAELRQNPESRRAVIVYTRPEIWRDYDAGGMSDFVCTNTVQYFIRDGALVSLVQMRSNDVWAGYRNDRAWQKHVHEALACTLGLRVGSLIWHVGSLHIYERNFYLVDGFIKTGRHDLTKSDVAALGAVTQDAA